MRIQQLLPSRILILLLASMGLVSSGFAQYYAIQYEGISSDFAAGVAGDEILGGSIGSFNEQMSAAQTLPFPFSFYGQTVTQYRASDNGYITFDVTNTTSVGLNTTLPSASAPTNAIFGYWDDWELNTTPGLGTVDAIHTYTTGVAPNRVHVIKWISVSRVGLPSNTNFVWMAIRLYESGDVPFDVAHLWKRSQAAGLFSGTIGCQDATGATGTMLTGSPNIDLPNFEPDLGKTLVTAFKSGTQPQFDTWTSGFKLPLVASVNSQHQITGKVFNHGSAPISSLTLAYSVNGGTPVPFTPTLPTTLNPNDKYEFTHPTPYVASTAGQYADIRVFVQNINSSQPDANPDSAYDDLFVNNGTNAPGKRVLVEEFASAPCGYCPDGALFIQQVRQNYPGQVVFAQHHAPIGTDAMTIPAHQTYASAFTSSAPSANIDRVLFSGEGNIAVSRSTWSSRVGGQLFAITPMSLNVETYFDATTRQITAYINMDFVDHTRTRDLQLTVFAVEDSVTGVGSGYDQINYYSAQSNAAGGASHPYYSQPDPIPGYVHRDVVRAVLSDVWGDPVVADGLQGGSHTMTYTYTVPASYDLDQMLVAAFVSFNESDLSERFVLNADDQHLQLRGVGIQDLTAEGFKAGVYPNPAQDQATVAFELAEQADLSIEVVNILGQPIANLSSDRYTAGEHQLNLETSSFASGIYFVRFTTDKGVYTHKFAVSK